MGIWGRFILQAFASEVSFSFNSGFGKRRMLSSGLSFHKVFPSKNFVNNEGRVRLEILPQGLSGLLWEATGML